MGDLLSKLLQQNRDTMRFADEEVEHHQFRTGLIGLNHVIGINGYIPGGSIIQLIGEPKHGKSTLAADMVAQAQKSGVREIEIPYNKKSRTVNAVWLDFEHSFDPDYASKIGIDVTKLLVLETRYGEEAFALVEALLAEGLQMVVVDSVSMFDPKSEEDKTLSDPEKMSAIANPLTRILRRMLHLVAAADALMILINQYRANISTMSRKEKKPFGARAIQYVVKVTIELVRVKNEQNKADVVATVEKTKLGAEGRQVPFQMQYGQGINYKHHVLTLAEEYGIIERAGARYTFEHEKVIQKAHGMEKATQEFNIPLIESLVEKKLEAERAALQSQSWAWQNQSLVTKKLLAEREGHEQVSILNRSENS